MNHTPIHPVGTRVTDLSLGELPDETADELRALLAEHGALIFAGQENLDDDGFVAFLRSFGEIAFTEGEQAAPGAPDLNVVSNVGRATPPRSSFHVDTSYVSRPPAYTALRAVTIPQQGGETLFSNQYRAYETLPPSVRERLQGRLVTHVVTGLNAESLSETEAQHPLFRRHPLTGRTSLYLSTAARCTAISGLDDGEARDTIAMLLEHSTREDNVYHHRWAPGDVVMWDNSCVLHRADHAHVLGDRVMHRGMVADYVTPGSGPRRRTASVR